MQTAKLLSVSVLIGLFSLMFGFGVVMADEDSETAVEKTTEDPAVKDLQDKISERKKDVAELESRIKKLKKQISQKNQEANTLKNELSIIQNRVAKTELEIESTSIEIETTEQELAIIALAIDDKELTIGENKEWLGSLLREIRRTDQTSVVSVLLMDDSLSEFIKSKQQLAEMEANLDSSLKQLQAAKIALDERKVEELDRKDQLVALKVKLDHKHEELKGEEGRKTLLIAQTKSSEKKYSSLVADLKSQAKSIEAEVFNLERTMRQRLTKEGKLTSDGPFSLMWPVPSMYVTSKFHDPGYPFRHIFEHSGTDIRARQSTSLNAAAAGYVARARDNGMGYSYIMLIHPQGFSTVYGHVSKMYVKKGEYVQQGDIIGLSGGTPGTRGAGPFVTGPHLHFEVRKDGVPVNAELFLP
ncbi:MAG: hypothetical protein CMI52_00730 [Parcubacteria group bacterium]|nr:hypothetical protein [Parcubacteria group bacterium]|tara:strand:- start:561 stop:1805 length:1245 start_codon:yes stop_codon:yes gene_type:complete